MALENAYICGEGEREEPILKETTPLQFPLDITFTSKDILATVDIIKDDKDVAQSLEDLKLASVDSCPETEDLELFRAEVPYSLRLNNGKYLADYFMKEESAVVVTSTPESVDQVLLKNINMIPLLWMQFYAKLNHLSSSRKWATWPKKYEEGS